MKPIISQSYTIRNCSWVEFKNFYNIKQFVMQSDEDDLLYYIWAYDGQESFLTNIYKNEVPEIVVTNGYSQAQNNLDKTDYLTNFKALCNRKIEVSDVFSSKTIGLKKLFRRKHGYTIQIVGGVGVLRVACPYDVAKINEIEIVNCEIGDEIDLSVLDKAVGPVTGVPNLNLNQFGFAVKLPSDIYRDVSNYDADIIKNFQIELTFRSTTQTKNVGVNIVFHEVK